MTTRFDYINQLFPEDKILQSVHQAIVENDMPPISVPADLGRLLTFFVHVSGAKRILEIGALGGYSGICLARGLPADGQLISLELKQQFADIAQQQLSQAGFANQVSYLIGEATHNLERLVQANEEFDIVFIDADKLNYPLYLDYAIQLSHPGTLIIADNVLLKDRVCNPETTSPSPTAVRQFNQTLASHPRLEALILPIHDGLALARVIA